MRGAVFVAPVIFYQVSLLITFGTRGLWQVAKVQPVNHYLNGSYTHTTVTFIFDEGRESIKFKSQSSIRRVVSPTRHLERTRRVKL